MSTDKNNKKSNNFMIWDEVKWEPTTKQISQFTQLQELLEKGNYSKKKKQVFISESQSLRDKEIIDFLGTAKEDI